MHVRGNIVGITQTKRMNPYKMSEQRCRFSCTHLDCLVFKETFCVKLRKERNAIVYTSFKSNNLDERVIGEGEASVPVSILTSVCMCAELQLGSLYYISGSE